MNRRFTAMLRPISTLLALALVAGASIAAPAQAEKSAAAADSTDTYETKHYHYLSFPRLLWSAAVYPLGQFAIYAERGELRRRVVDLFTNADGTFGLFPYARLGGETGSGGGFTTFHNDLFGKGKEFHAQFVYAGSGQSGQAFYSDENVAGGNLYWRADAAYLQTHNEGATINGPIREDELRRLEIERFDLQATLGWRAHADELEEYRSNLSIEGRIGAGTRDLRQRRWVQTLAPWDPPGMTKSAAGFGGLGDGITMASFGGRIAWDDRDYKQPTGTISHPLNYQLPGRVLLVSNDQYFSFRDLAYPERGGLLQLEADVVAGSKEVLFLRTVAEVQRFFTLFYKDRILALRALSEKVHPMGENKMAPYSDLPTLGGSQRLRGSRRGVFRGEGSLLLSAEYRYPVWDTWNAFLFWDEGQVFDEYDQVRVGRFRSSWGGGLSLRTETAFLIGLRLSHSSAEHLLTGFSLEKEF